MTVRQMVHQTVAIAVTFFLLMVPLLAQSTLVVVNLPDQARIDAWRALRYPTYAFLDHSAFAEVDRPDVDGLIRRGFAVQIVDEHPWTANYFLVRPDPGQDAALSPWRVWSRNGLVLLKTNPDQLASLVLIIPHPYALRRLLLSDRFWNTRTTTTVYLPVRWESGIQGLVDQVNTDSLTSYVTRMQNFQTRLSYTDSGFATSQWIRQKFNTFGLPAVFDSFYLTQTWWGLWPDTGFERNVVARSIGQYDPDLEFIVAGHFDSFLFPDTPQARTFAPGADDNASGTASVLEIARIFGGLTWDATIKYIGFGCEEMGLMGSGYDAYMADSLNRDIGCVINMDMVAYMDDAVYDVRIQRMDSSAQWIANLFYDAARLYVPAVTVYDVETNSAEDWFPYAQLGFPAAGCAENQGTQYNPHWHQVTDVIGNMTPALHVMSTKACLATMAIFGLYPRMVADVTAADLGDGSRLVVSWTPMGTGGDIAGYRIYWGRASGAYADSQEVSGPTVGRDTIGGLVPDSAYFIAVTAVDNAGRRSYAANEITAIPRIAPLAPTGVTATPLSGSIRVDWRPNLELDIAGYRLYCRLNENSTYDSLATLPFTDTSYLDLNLGGANRYYYALRAFDSNGNTSPYSAEAYGRPITLDQGILIVDETRNGTNPPDSLQDAFYSYILQDYRNSAFDYGSAANGPVFADLVPYSTIAWFCDDYGELMASGSVANLERYLDLGGNLWIAGWKPMANFDNNLGYPLTFAPGEFAYDYLKISRAALSAISDSFQAANGRLDYPRIAVDTTKVPIPGWNKTLRYIEAYDPAVSEAIFTIDLKNNGSPLENDTCGVRGLAGSYRTAVFGFPLYFMDREQARLATRQVMTDFGELTVAEPTGGTAALGSDLQLTVYPNPCVRGAVISYHLRSASAAQLAIYNAAGGLVERIVDRVAPSGAYRVVWSGKDKHGRALPAGIYFVALRSGDCSMVRKVTLLR